MVRLFSVGTAAALVFPKVFFNDLTPELATLASMASFAVAFVLRPLGGMVIGHFGDQMGHKKMLVFTLLVMVLCTAGIVFLPSYSAVGHWSPALLILLSSKVSLGWRMGWRSTDVCRACTHGSQKIFGSTLQIEVAPFVQTVVTGFKVEPAGRYAAVLIAGSIAK